MTVPNVFCGTVEWDTQENRGCTACPLSNWSLAWTLTFPLVKIAPNIVKLALRGSMLVLPLVKALDPQ